MFSHLHVHDAKGSLLDSILKVEDIAKFAKENNQGAIALTNHGYMTSYVDFVLACNKYGVKPIIGNEVYEVDNMNEKNDTKEYRQPRYHLVLLAATQEGFKNLIKITSVSCTDGFYEKPRIDLNYIKNNKLGEGIICLTACQAGRLSKYLDGGREKDAKKFIDNLHEIFDYVVCELQSHNTEDQARCNKLIYEFSQKYNLPYTITTDAHMLDESLLDSHALFIEIAEDREAGEMYSGCYLQTESQIFETLDGQFSREVIKKGINETQNIVNMIDDIDIGITKKAIMPKVKIEEGFDNNKEYLRYLVFKTFDDKFGHLSLEEQEKRRQRLETELPILYEVDYTDYFIMLYMLAKEARKRGIPLGYSRGSGGNCLCLFMLNVTQIDSVRWGLDFSRFANLGRRSMADFDWDISKRRRKELVEISEELFGKNNVAPIATFNTLSTKVAIRDIGKVLNEKEWSPYFGLIPYSLRDNVAKMIPTIKTLNDLGEEEEKELLLKDILNKNPKLKEVHDKFPLWFKYVMDVEGLPKSMGRHAAGTLITPKEITEYCPLCYDSEKNIMVQLEMHNAMDTLGLVKMDFLGLETLDIIDDTLKLANLTWDNVDINHLNLDDSEVYDRVYKKGNTIGIFQMESYEAKKMCVEAQANNIEDIIVVNSANRPGTKDSFPDYCKNKLYPEQTVVLHEDLKKLFKQSRSVLLYQEQALSLLRYAYISEEEVDNGRRCIEENSLILMSDGTKKKIKDVKVGDKVLSFNENGYSEERTVINVFDNGEKDTFVVNTIHGGELIATKDHKVLTELGWKRVDELIANNYIMTPNNINAASDDVLAKYKPRSEIMFLLGLLIGDGSLKSPSDIHFTNSDVVLIESFKNCCNFLSRKKEPCQFRETFQKGVTVDRIYHIYIKDKSYKNGLKRLLKKYDLNKLAGDKCLPKEFMADQTGVRILHLLAGLFNTDGGYVKQSGCIEYCSKSKVLVEQIKVLLLKFGIYSYVHGKNAKNYNYLIYTLRIQQIDALRKFKALILPIMVGRKKEEFEKVISSRLENNLAYNYSLPLNYTQELYDVVIKNPKISQNALGNILGYDKNNFKISAGCNINDIKAKKIISQVYAPKTYKLLMADYIPLKITSIKHNKVAHVYDLEVEGNHNYVANDIIVHNCIGKKDEAGMKKLKPKVRDGLIKRGWNDQQVEEIWNLLLKQSSYCFNRGHAVAYSLLSYLTAYLKTHYTIYFMAALLSSKSDKVEKISLVINDCNRLEIKVSPPNVNLSGRDFTAIPEKNEILFGLLAVKGLGESIVNKIIENQKYEGFRDFVEKISDRTAIIALIKAGALPVKNKMQALRKYADMLFERKQYFPVNTLPPYKKLLLEWDIDKEDYLISPRKYNKEKMLRDYNAKREEVFNQDQLEKYKAFMNDFKDKYAKDEYLWEFETLSMFLTKDPLKESYNYITRNWENIDDGEETVVLCVIVDIKRKKDKNGNQFAYLDLYTPSGIIEATIWSSQLKNYSDLIKKGECLAMLGRKREGGHFFVSKVKPYNQWLIDIKKKKKGLVR